MRTCCNGNNFDNEDEFRDDLSDYLQKHGYKTQTEFQVDASPESGNEYWLVDIMVKKNDHDWVPIELKFNEDNKEEVDEDIKKLKFCKNHHRNVNEGYFILLTNVQESKYELYLEDTIFHPYRYMLKHV
jgi:hypothetical protein